MRWRQAEIQTENQGNKVFQVIPHESATKRIVILEIKQMGIRHLPKVSTGSAVVNCTLDLYSPNSTNLCLFHKYQTNRISEGMERNHEILCNAYVQAQALPGELQNTPLAEGTLKGNAGE